MRPDPPPAEREIVTESAAPTYPEIRIIPQTPRFAFPVPGHFPNEIVVNTLARSLALGAPQHD